MCIPPKSGGGGTSGKNCPTKLPSSRQPHCGGPSGCSPNSGRNCSTKLPSSQQPHCGGPSGCSPNSGRNCPTKLPSSQQPHCGGPSGCSPNSLISGGNCPTELPSSQYSQCSTKYSQCSTMVPLTVVGPYVTLPSATFHFKVCFIGTSPGVLKLKSLGDKIVALKYNLGPPKCLAVEPGPQLQHYKRT